MNLTRNQWFAIVGVILSALMTSTAFLTDTFGPTTAHSIIGAAGFVNMIMNGIVVTLSGQTQQIKDVTAMSGVERITVNAQANQALAAVAVSNDPSAAKVEATPAAEAAVTKTASAA